MKKLIILILTACLLAVSLTACETEEAPFKKPSITDEDYTVRYIYNFTDEVVLESGRVATADSAYKIVDIVVGESIVPPADPTLAGYAFTGWYTDKGAQNAFDFSAKAGATNLTLFAGWARAAGNIEGAKTYRVKSFSFVESVRDSGEPFILTGVLNTNIVSGKVKLTAGAIQRLVANAADVKELLNYSRLASTTIISAIYDADNGMVRVTYNAGAEQTVSVAVEDVSISKKLTNITYENKAQKYETDSVNAEAFQVMLAGSSSMEFWTNYKEDLNPIVANNHGIGGTTVLEWRDSLAERLIFPYSPTTVVLYVGVNDIINSGRDGEATGNAVVELMQKIHAALPSANVYYVLINSLPGYQNKQRDFDTNNQIVNAFVAGNEWAYAIDAGTNLMKDSGKPHKAYFRSDGLHMSIYGYELWGECIKDYIYETSLKTE